MAMESEGEVMEKDGTGWRNIIEMRNKYTKLGKEKEEEIQLERIRDNKFY